MTLSDEALMQAAGVTFPKSTKITPMLRQWLEAKAKAKDAVLLFRMGDFYELFATDAEQAGALLELAITTRDRDKGDDAIAMAGFPHHAAPQYIAKLIQAGLKVAVCDQLEDPSLAKGIVKRDITRVVTPGMVLDDESLDAAANNFLVGVVQDGRTSGSTLGVAGLDLSTGGFWATCCRGESALSDELSRLAPREIVVSATGDVPTAVTGYLRRPRDGAAPRLEVYEGPLQRSHRLASLGPLDGFFAQEDQALARQAAELCLAYVEDTQGQLPTHLCSPRPYSVDAHLLLDHTTKRHLDLVGPAGHLRAPGTLASVVDVTQTAPGGRMLLSWLLAPSSDGATISSRHDLVEAFVMDPGCRRKVREILRGIYDIERLVARIAAGRAGPRELARLRDSLGRVPRIQQHLRESGGDVLPPLAETVEDMQALRERLDGALVDEPPLVLGGGLIFRAGFDPVLDEFVTLSTGSKAAIAQVEERERQNTGIPNLKVKYTRVFGYYLEVTKTHLSKVPDHYRRKQTVANAERFVTEELSRLEERVATADTRRNERETMLFEALRQELAEQAQHLLRLAESLARIDVFAAFGEISDEKRYRRPVVLPAAAKRLRIVRGRHPVVEQALGVSGEPFVPSDIELAGDDRQVVLVTGPNMAGKSTLMRQVALIQILAQAGCFVPAEHAELSICDRIFTRVGASDDLAQGRSTFMVEMTETAHILRHASPQSLVLLDEIGRGTSTFDGLSLAWAVAEFLHDHSGARTLFATHYHELCDLAEALPRVRNVHVVVKEWNDEIIFTRTLAEGGAERSYGIQVARLAGLPTPVIARAREVLALLEGDAPSAAHVDRPGPKSRKRGGAPAPQLDFFRPGDAVAAVAEPPRPAPEQLRVLEQLAQTDVNRLTPIDAMNVLAHLVDEARKSDVLAK